MLPSLETSGMATHIRRRCLALATLLVAACSDATAPAGEPRPPVPQPPGPLALPPPPRLQAPPFPPAPASSVVYDAPEGLYSNYVYYHGGDLRSRFVLHEDGTFGLQYSSPTWGLFEYPGRYVVDRGSVTFGFDANGGRWHASGTLDGDLMQVRFNVDMSLSDFEDGSYRRAGRGP
jgi:hypothetical protein